jgi:uncharacterized membrane protein YkvA (DUF1232 family)
MTLGDLGRYLRAPDVGKGRKVLLLLAVAYVISPIDAIPDVIPVIGWLDDIGVLGLAATMLLNDARAFSLARKAAPALPS